MKIERKNLKEMIKFLKEIDLKMIDDTKSKIVFPVDMENTKEIDGLDLTLVNNKFGSEKLPEPCLELLTERQGALLSYCDLTYGRRFDIVVMCDLLGIKLSKKAREAFNNVECYLVNEQNILIKLPLETK